LHGCSVGEQAGNRLFPPYSDWTLTVGVEEGWNMVAEAVVKVYGGVGLSMGS